MFLREESEDNFCKICPDGSAKARFVLRWEEEDDYDDDNDNEPAHEDADEGYENDDEDEYDDE